MNKKITYGVVMTLLLSVLNAKAQSPQKMTYDNMQIPQSVIKKGEKRILFPDNFSNPYTKLTPETKSRTVHFIQNDAQPQMVTKVYELKYLRASDATPFILGAVKRFSPQSNVQRLNYKHGKKQFLLVSTGQQMMPYVDKMIEQMDIPGLKDQVGSLVSGTGITRGSYQPKYRSGDDFVGLLNSTTVGQGYVWNNAPSNIIYWKTDHYHSERKVRHWLKYLDRPLPQVKLTFKVYEVRESDLLDVGIDYNAWKNGPGLGLFSFSFEDLWTRASEEIMNLITSESVSMLGSSNFAWGGAFFAPPVDMSFIRLLSQNGAATVSATGSLTVLNDYTGSYPLTLAPEYQTIRKGDNDQTDIASIPSKNARFFVNIKNPTICLRQSKKEEYGEYNYTHFSPKTYNEIGGAVIFGFRVLMNTPVERNNLGQVLIDSSEINSSITLNVGTEKLLGSYDSEQEVEQTVGIPWLIEIPYLKYIFGSTTKIKIKNTFFVSVKGELIHPDNGQMEGDFKNDIALVEKAFAPKHKKKKAGKTKNEQS